MRVFKEEQSFRQWWLILIAIGCTGLLLTYIISVSISGDFLIKPTAFILSFVTILFFAFLFSLGLHTRIDQNGIKTWWEPFHFLEKEFAWEDLQKVYVRKYKPVQEYGGWGIKGKKKNKVYSVSGNNGIQLVSSKGRFLIGTQNVADVQSILNRYKL